MLYRCADCDKKIGSGARLVRGGRVKREHSKIIGAATIVSNVVKQCMAGRWCPDHGKK